MAASRRVSLIAAAAVDVVLYFASSVTADEFPGHDVVDTTVTVFVVLFWIGILLLTGLIVAAPVRPLRQKRG
jgi:hypothetical protein